MEEYKMDELIENVKSELYDALGSSAIIVGWCNYQAYNFEVYYKTIFDNSPIKLRFNYPDTMSLVGVEFALFTDIVFEVSARLMDNLHIQDVYLTVIKAKLEQKYDYDFGFTYKIVTGTIFFTVFAKGTEAITRECIINAFEEAQVHD